MIVKDLSNSFNPLPKEKKKNKYTETVKDKTYQEVIKRDKYKCRLCNTTRDLELHHIDGRGKNLTNNVNNCIMLCYNCHHNKVHKNQKKYRPKLKEIIEKTTRDNT